MQDVYGMAKLPSKPSAPNHRNKPDAMLRLPRIDSVPFYATLTGHFYTAESFYYRP